MKGGVGKTTLTAAIFREMHKVKGRRVLLIDFDPQYNLTQLLVSESDYDDLQASGKTSWHVLTPPAPTTVFQVSDEDVTSPGPVESYVHPLRSTRTGAGRVDIDLLAGNFQTAAINLLTSASSLNVRAARFRAFIQSAREAYDIVVLDCNPASSFMTRTAVEVATNLLIPVRPDRYSILGLDMIVDFMHGLATLGKQPELSIVVNEIATHGQSLDVVAQLRSNSFYGPRTLANVVRESKHLTAHILGGGFPTDRSGPYSDILRGQIRLVMNELATMMGVP